MKIIYTWDPSLTQDVSGKLQVEVGIHYLKKCNDPGRDWKPGLWVRYTLLCTYWLHNMFVYKLCKFDFQTLVTLPKAWFTVAKLWFSINGTLLASSIHCYSIVLVKHSSGVVMNMFFLFHGSISFLQLPDRDGTELMETVSRNPSNSQNEIYEANPCVFDNYGHPC